MLKLGDGTDESHRRVQRALDELWRFTAELFAADDVDRALAGAGVAPDLAALRAAVGVARARRRSSARR